MRTLLIALGAAVLVLLLGMTTIGLLFRPTITVKDQAVSPDGKYVATAGLTVYGGPSADVFTSVLLRERENSWWFVPGERDIVLSVEDVVKVSLSWQEERVLLVEYEGSRFVTKLDGAWKDVQIVYRQIAN